MASNQFFINRLTSKGKIMKTYDLPKKYADQAMQEADNMLLKQHVTGIFDEGDPNHPKYNGGWNYALGAYVEIFGYSQADLLAKQYK